MQFNQSKINEYVNELSYLTDLNTCIYFDGYQCSKHCKQCKGKIDDPSNIPPCNGKDFKTIVDSITDRLDLNQKGGEQA